MGWLGGLVSIVLLLPHATQADVFMKQNQHTDAMSIMGQTQPAEDLVTEIWITDTKMVSSNAKQKLVFDLTKKVVTFANHEQKTVATMPMDFSKMMDQQAGDMSAEDKADFQQFMGRMMNIKVNVQPTSEKKKIGQWNCTKYIQTMKMGMGTITSEIWATTDINIDQDLYAQFTTAVMAQMPGVSQNAAEIIKESKKIKGVQVFTTQTTEMMGQSFGSTVELLEYKEGKAPISAFAMPAGYKEQTMFE
jgi:hypothetical protein